MRRSKSTPQGRLLHSIGRAKSSHPHALTLKDQKKSFQSSQNCAARLQFPDSWWMAAKILKYNKQRALKTPIWAKDRWILCLWLAALLLLTLKDQLDHLLHFPNCAVCLLTPRNFGVKIKNINGWHHNWHQEVFYRVQPNVCHVWFICCNIPQKLKGPIGCGRNSYFMRNI